MRVDHARPCLPKFSSSVGYFNRISFVLNPAFNLKHVYLIHVCCVSEDVI